MRESVCGPSRHFAVWSLLEVCRLMRFRSVQTAKLDPLDRHLESAHAATVAWVREVLESASERLSILRRAGKTAHIEPSAGL
jgi:hypothetical protein